MIYSTLTVELPVNPYPIYIGVDLFSNLSLLQQHIQGSQVLIVTQENIAQHYLAQLQAALSSLQCDVLLITNGEHNKSLLQWQAILDKLIECKHERSTTLIALGGGVVGDITGFAAACYQRGVNYIQIPTTLIAQVDAAIGGKTAVNHPLGKNLLGAFHQPACVIADIQTLTTLPEREFKSGLAEIIKYALIMAPDFFVWLETNIHLLLAREPQALQYAIAFAAASKAKIVATDEKDQGMRQLLNFGHTFGHAIEAALNYQTILHGEAVAYGMLMAAELSGLLQKLSVNEVQRIRFLIAQSQILSYPLSIPNKLMSWMQRDKKIQHGVLQFIVLNKIGQAEKISVQDFGLVQVAIEKVLSHSFAEV